MQRSGSESSRNQRQRRRSISESFRRAFGSRGDSQSATTRSSNAGGGVRGRHISDPILPEGGLPILALVRPALQPPERAQISHPSELSRRGAASGRRTSDRVLPQGNVPPPAVVQPTLRHPERALPSNPYSFSGRVARIGPPISTPTSPRGVSLFPDDTQPTPRLLEGGPPLNPLTFSRGSLAFSGNVRPTLRALESRLTHPLALQRAARRSSLRLDLIQPGEQRPPGVIPTTIAETPHGNDQGDNPAPDNIENIGISPIPSGNSSSSGKSVHQNHPWQHILTDEIFKKLLQSHATRNRFSDSLSRLGNNGPALLNIWLATKAQKAAQEYVEILSGEIRQLATKTLGYGATETGGAVGQLAFKKLLLSELPRAIDVIIENWFSSAALQDAINSDSAIPIFSGRNLALSKGEFRDLFKSLSISDPHEPAHPVRLTSRALQDRESPLRTALTGTGQPCTIHTAYDPKGEPSSYSLLFTTPLLSQATGRTRYLLTSQVDITRFVQRHVADALLTAEVTGDTNVQEELDTAVAGTYKEYPGSHPRLKATVLLDNAFRWGAIGELKLSEKVTTVPAEAEASKPPATSGWPGIPCEGKWKERSVPEEPHPPRPAAPSREPQSVDFPALVKEIKSAYREYFTMSPSTRDREVYTISYISPALLADGEYITGHLTHTAPQVVQDIALGLARYQSPNPSHTKRYFHLLTCACAADKIACSRFYGERGAHLSGCIVYQVSWTPSPRLRPPRCLSVW